MRSVIVGYPPSNRWPEGAPLLRHEVRPCFPKPRFAFRAEDRCGADQSALARSGLPVVTGWFFAGGSQPGDRAVRSLTAAFDWIGVSRSARPARCRCLFSNPDL